MGKRREEKEKEEKEEEKRRPILAPRAALPQAAGSQKLNSWAVFLEQLIFWKICIEKDWKDFQSQDDKKIWQRRKIWLEYYLCKYLIQISTICHQISNNLPLSYLSTMTFLSFPWAIPTILPQTFLWLSYCFPTTKNCSILPIVVLFWGNPLQF